MHDGRDFPGKEIKCFSGAFTFGCKKFNHGSQRNQGPGAFKYNEGDIAYKYGSKTCKRGAGHIEQGIREAIF